MKKVISTEKAPAAIGPYSQAIEVNGMVYTSGIIPVVPETGEIPEGSVAQAKQALTNLSNLLEAAGTNMDNVVKTTVFIKEMNDFSAINDVYKTFFTADFPSRSCVEVARLPKDVMLEIEAIANKKGKQFQRTPCERYFGTVFFMEIKIHKIFMLYLVKSDKVLLLTVPGHFVIITM